MTAVDRQFTSLRRAALRAVVAIGVVLSLAGCTNSDESPEVSRDGQIYAIVIADVVDHADVSERVPDKLPVLFVESFAPDGVPLEVQVELIAQFATVYELRFVDDRVEAVQDDVVARPVRVGGVFVGVGRIVDEDPEGESVTIRVESYVDESNVTAYRYTVTDRDDDNWDVDGPPEEIEPEGFVVTT